MILSWNDSRIFGKYSTHLNLLFSINYQVNATIKEYLIWKNQMSDEPLKNRKQLQLLFEKELEKLGLILLNLQTGHIEVSLRK